jgi:hypothetical protein
MIAQELADSDRKIYDDFLIAILIAGLPSTYEAFVAGMINSLRLKDSKDLGPDDLKTVMDSLLDEQKRMELEKTTSSAFSACRRTVTCSHCKKTGHGVEKCWQKNPELRPKKFSDKKDQDESSNDDVDDATKAYTARRITAFAARRIATMHTGNIHEGDHIKVGALSS